MSAAATDNEEVMQTTAVLRARRAIRGSRSRSCSSSPAGTGWRSGVAWRHTLLTAWATFRAGRDGAGELAARALEQALACGGVRVAQAGEPEIVAALAPLAEARRLGGRARAAARRPRADRPPVRNADGRRRGRFGDPAAARHARRARAAAGAARARAAGRRRARAVLPGGDPDGRAPAPATGAHAPADGSRGRSSCVTVTILRLVPAWVDVREFLAIGNRVRGAIGSRAVQLAYAALALRTGPLLPSDPYAGWAEEARAQVRYRYLALLISSPAMPPRAAPTRRR